MSVAVLLVAGGAGRRLGAPVPKAFVELEGKPLVWHALTRIAAVPAVTHIVCVVPDGWESTTQELLSELRPCPSSVSIVVGGAERHDSVRAGLTVVKPDIGMVLVHDAARCFAPPELFEAVIEAVPRAGAVVPGLPVTDTIKQVDASGAVITTPPRSSLRAVQTPQGFARNLLERAHAAASGTPTDDAAMVEALGEQVVVIDGHLDAHKITTPDDLRWGHVAAGCSPALNHVSRTLES